MSEAVKPSCFSVTRKLREGDIIICQGTRATIGKVLYQSCYIDTTHKMIYEKYHKSNPERYSHSEDKTYIDIEFTDTYGNYRHWKSELDGGLIIFMESEEEKAGKLKGLRDEFIKLCKNTGETILSARDDLMVYAMEQGISLTNNQANAIVISVIGNMTWEE